MHYMSLVPSQSGFFYSGESRNNPAKLPAKWGPFLIYFREIIRDVLELLPVAVFIFISAIPTQALAFVQQIEMPHQPLLFEIDPNLEQSAFNANLTTRSRSAQIPNAPKTLVPGMAVRMLLTAYSSTADQTDSDPFTTAAGTQVSRHTLAANFIPLGTRVRIGDQEFTVLDRLNARYDHKLIGDKWVASREEAIQFGVRVVEMEIISLP